MAKLGNVKVVYLSDGKKKNATGEGSDEGEYIKIALYPSKRRKKFDTILIPWNNVIKVIVMK